MDKFFDLLDLYIDTKAELQRVLGAQMTPELKEEKSKEVKARIVDLRSEMNTALTTYVGRASRRSGV